MFLSAFVWNINPFLVEIPVFQVKLAAILKMGDPPIVTDTFCPNKHDFLLIDIRWPPKLLVLEKNCHSGNPNIRKYFSDGIIPDISHESYAVLPLRNFEILTSKPPKSYQKSYQNILKFLPKSYQIIVKFLPILT